MNREAEKVLADAANALTLAISQNHPVYESEHRSIFEAAGAFLDDYLPYIDECVSDDELEQWLREVMQQTRMLDPAILEENYYIKHVHALNGRNEGKYFLGDSFYEAGEMLLYDMPLVKENRIVPKIGCFPRRVRFPSVYEDEIPWMSVIPSEINSMQEDLQKVEGNLIVLGLGLGYFAMMAASKDTVQKVTVAEKSEEVIALFRQEILPCFPAGIQSKVHIVQQDAFAYLKQTKERPDYCYCDLWLSQKDGQPMYQRLKQLEEHFPQTKFLYWIEEFLK